MICKHCGGVCPRFCPHDVLEMIEVEDSGEVKVTDTGPAPDTSPISLLHPIKTFTGGEKNLGGRKNDN